MKLSRLRGRKICDRVQHKGAVWKGATFVIRWLPGPPHHPAADPQERAVYAGTLASSKLHKSAVKRNRMRRRCREALRTELRLLQDISTMQLLLFPRSRSLTCDFADIQADVRRFLSVVSHGSKK
ncbi:ribonuclease P protein component [Candidatus Peregrinibacteria bacterium CG10_big_fil_rev_8_21_14_0_10_55_24]|nr:MAG: ribonuclease P protein component [Candidatus Peregrinibacteria bacterium CG10_big_fil_rev_8_21_14_0_10_55_24]